MENNNISGERKPEMITNKKGNVHIIGNSNLKALKLMEESIKNNSVILVGNARSGKTAAMQDLTERLNQTGFTISEFNSASKAFKNIVPTTEDVLKNIIKATN